MPILALDVGGTKIAGALVDETGDILTGRVAATPRSSSADEVFAAVAGVLTGLLGQTPAPDPAGRVDARPARTVQMISGVGVGSAGPVDLVHGTVSPVNIGAWRDFPLRDRIGELVPGLPVRLCGDGICAAIAEHWRGAGEQVPAMLGVVVSTGVGGGLILAGRPFLGPTGNAGHVGHVPVDLNGERCRCGSRGCVETIASGPNLVRGALARGWQPLPGATAEQLAASAQAGDPIAVDAFARAGRALAAGFASVAATCDIDRVVVGGGVALSGSVLFDAIAAGMAEFSGLSFTRRVTVHPARLGPAAGLVGAAALLLRPDAAGVIAVPRFELPAVH